MHTVHADIVMMIHFMYCAALYNTMKPYNSVTRHSVCSHQNSSYLQGPKQLAAVLYPCNVKQLIDGSVGKLRAKLCVSLNGIQYLVFIFGSSHL